MYRTSDEMTLAIKQKKNNCTVAAKANSNTCNMFTMQSTSGYSSEEKYSYILELKK